jgi:hypothetical protein
MPLSLDTPGFWMLRLYTTKQLGYDWYEPSRGEVIHIGFAAEVRSSLISTSCISTDLPRLYSKMRLQPCAYGMSQITISSPRRRDKNQYLQSTSSYNRCYRDQPFRLSAETDTSFVLDLTTTRFTRFLAISLARY